MDWRDYVRRSPVDSVVGLLSSSYKGVTNAMTVSQFAESSHVPPLVRVSIAKDSLTHELVSASGRFGLGILAEGQAALALACGSRSGRLHPKDRLPGLVWRFDLADVPLVGNVRAVSACRVVECHDLGEYSLFVGDILDAWRETGLAARPSLRLSDLAGLTQGAATC